MAGRCGCTSGCTCCSSASPSVAVAGSGGAGQCHSYSVRYSTDVGNRARAGTDGAVFSDVCLLDPAGEPLAPDGQTCLQIPPPVILDYGGGEPIAPNPDGSISLPTSGPPGAFGCGLTTLEGNLVVNTSGSWPPDDLSGTPLSGAYTEGSEIACGPDGKIRGVPDHTALSAESGQVLLDTILLPVTGTYESPASTALLMANPSGARQMIVRAVATAQVEISNPVEGGAIAVLERRVNGGSWVNIREVRWPEPTTGSIRAGIPMSATLNTTIGVGGTFSVELRVRVVKTGTGASPVLIRIASGSGLLGVTI